MNGGKEEECKNVESIVFSACETFALLSRQCPGTYEACDIYPRGRRNKVALNPENAVHFSLENARADTRKVIVEMVSQ
jgi:hypothetical protein